MDDFIKDIITDYNNECITWHDIQDLVEGYLIKQAGGLKEYSKIPMKERINTENEILRKIENKIMEVK